MVKLQDIMTRDVIALDPEISLREALEILTTRHISGAPVVEADRVVGVLSAMDIIEFLATTSGVPDITDPVDGDLRPLDDPAEGSAAYFIDFWSDADDDVTERFSDPTASRRDLLTVHTVAEAMNRTPVAFPPMAGATAAADAMQRAHAHRVLVIDEGRLTGIVSALDIARAVAQRTLEQAAIRRPAALPRSVSPA